MDKELAELVTGGEIPFEPDPVARMFKAADVPELRNALEVLGELRRADLISRFSYSEARESVLDRLAEAEAE